jgi:hypothetical protein
MSSQADDTGPSNAEIQQLIERALVRFQNWRVTMETNPNPRMVHSLKNIVSIIDNLAGVADKRIEYSYKQLARKMALMLQEVSELNVLICDSLEDDDIMDKEEEDLIISTLMQVVQSATELIRTVQAGFGTQRQISLNVKSLSDLSSSESSPEGEVETE